MDKARLLQKEAAASGAAALCQVVIKCGVQPFVAMRLETLLFRVWGKTMWPSWMGSNLC